MKLQHCRSKRSGFHSFRAIDSTVIITVIVGLSLTVFCGKSAAEETTNNRTFDITSDSDFRNYKNVIETFVRKHRLRASNDFCILGYVAGDNSKLAWVLWRQGRQIILWENQETDLDFSRRKINLETDVVETDSDLHGSTYLVTRAWVDNFTTTCNRLGTKLSIGKR